MADVADRVEEHFRLFNEAVRSQDWTAFLATFTPDAVMRFEGVPAGPYTDAGGGGTLRLTWRDGAVAELIVTFDALWWLPRARDRREKPS